MIDHISIQVKEITKSTHFYESALSVFGYKKLEGDFGGAVAFSNGELSIWLIPSDSNGHTSNNTHIAFKATSVDQVKNFHDAAIAAGGKDHGAPGKVPEYGDDYYGGYVLDPDGNNIEAVIHIK